MSFLDLDLSEYMRKVTERALSRSVISERVGDRNGNKAASGCACTGCVSACLHLPGWFGPGEVEGAAAYMRMPRKRFIKEFIVHEIADDGTIVQRPRMMHEQGGSTLRDTPELGDPCVFLSPDGYCRIHAAKPAECLTYSCEMPVKRYDNRRSILRRWIDAGRPLGRGWGNAEDK